MKENLEDFYIPYRKTLNLPKNVTFGLEVEFKMDPFNDSYKSNFIDEDNAARVFKINSFQKACRVASNWKYGSAFKSS